VTGKRPKKGKSTPLAAFEVVVEQWGTKKKSYRSTVYLVVRVRGVIIKRPAELGHGMRDEQRYAKAWKVFAQAGSGLHVAALA